MKGRLNQIGARWPFPARPATSAWPMMSAVVATGAGVAAIAQPLGPAHRPMESAAHHANPAQIHATRINIALPQRIRITPTPSPEQHGLLRIALDTKPAADQASVALAPASAPPLAQSTAREPMVPEPAPQGADLVAARGTAPASYSAAPYEIAEIRPAKRTSMLGDENWADLTRPYDATDTPVSGTDRSAALRSPTPAPRPIAGAIPIKLDPEPKAGIPQLALPDTALQPREVGPREVGKVSFQVTAKINGTNAGRVSLLIQDDANISVRLADLLTILQSRLDSSAYDRLSGAKAAQAYVTFNELRASGIAVRFNDRDELLIGV